MIYVTGASLHDTVPHSHLSSFPHSLFPFPESTPLSRNYYFRLPLPVLDFIDIPQFGFSLMIPFPHSFHSIVCVFMDFFKGFFHLFFKELEHIHRRPFLCISYIYFSRAPVDGLMGSSGGMLSQLLLVVLLCWCHDI